MGLMELRFGQLGTPSRGWLVRARTLSHRVIPTVRGHATARSASIRLIATNTAVAETD